MKTEQENSKHHGHGNTALMAASAIRKMIKGDNQTKISVEVQNKDLQDPNMFDPMDGWAEGVSLAKSHYCLLLKPQIVLRGETPNDTCIVAAAQAKLQSFAIMDSGNFDDPVSGKVMSRCVCLLKKSVTSAEDIRRNYTSLSGFQTFAPSLNTKVSNNGSVPLEVLIDLRCESHAFERLVPQTEATFHYDRFNRLRLRNNISAIKVKAQNSTDSIDSHLQDETVRNNVVIVGSPLVYSNRTSFVCIYLDSLYQPIRTTFKPSRIL